MSEVEKVPEGQERYTPDLEEQAHRAEEAEDQARVMGVADDLSGLMKKSLACWASGVCIRLWRDGAWEFKAERAVPKSQKRDDDDLPF